jgi:hypothetical protein
MARAEWHFGDGPAYCRGCADLGRACAGGGVGETGQRCPEIETRPQTAAGWQAWDIALRCAGTVARDETRVNAIGQQQVMIDASLMLS